MDPLSAVIGLGSAGLNYMGQQETNDMQQQMQQQQMAFQERMSSTAYQRASTDMKAAGLNPMMMAHGGMNASSPAGSPASPLVKSGLDADAFQKAIGSAVAVNRADAEVEVLKSEKNMKDAQTLSELQRPSLLGAQTETEKARPTEIGARVEHTREMAKRLRTEAPIVANEALTASNESAINATARKVADQVAFGSRRASTIAKPAFEALHSAGALFRGLRPRPGNVTHRNEYGDREITINNPAGP